MDWIRVPNGRMSSTFVLLRNLIDRTEVQIQNECICPTSLRPSASLISTGRLQNSAVQQHLFN